MEICHDTVYNMFNCCVFIKICSAYISYPSMGILIVAGMYIYIYISFFAHNFICLLCLLLQINEMLYKCVVCRRDTKVIDVFRYPIFRFSIYDDKYNQKRRIIGNKKQKWAEEWRNFLHSSYFCVTLWRAKLITMFSLYHYSTSYVNKLISHSLESISYTI